MADNKSRSFVRSNSSGRKSSGNGARPKNTNVNQASSRDLLSREEEYKRLNEELEAKTATLVREAESVISEQSSLFNKTSLLDNAEADDLYREDDYRDEEEEADDCYTDRRVPVSQQPATQAKVHNEMRAQTHGRPPSRSKQPPGGRHTRSKSKNSKSNLSDDVATADEAFLTEFKDFSLQKAITSIEGRMGDDAGLMDDADDDVMPSAAAEMGAEAQIRFLKAKLRVMQEELDRLAADCNKKEDLLGEVSSRLKEVQEDKARFQRTSSSQQLQIDKYKRLAEEARGKADSLDNQLTASRKELDTMKRQQKKQVSNQSTVEVRLNRALEEVEKYKADLSKSKSDVKETKDGEKRKMEQLLLENKRLEKQKNELMAGFKKQLKLIDILKKQKMHIEAAKMLSFTEEEFVKALEWGQ